MNRVALRRGVLRKLSSNGSVFYLDRKRKGSSGGKRAADCAGRGIQAEASRQRSHRNAPPVGARVSTLHGDTRAIGIAKDAIEQRRRCDHERRHGNRRKNRRAGIREDGLRVYGLRDGHWSD